jgi:hypothetical protein
MSVIDFQNYGQSLRLTAGLRANMRGLAQDRQHEPSTTDTTTPFIPSSAKSRKTVGDAVELKAIDPAYWIVVFRPTSESLLVRLLSCGRFKHVSAMSYIPGIKAWVTYDVGFNGTKIVVVPDCEANAILGPWLAGCTLVKMRRQQMRPSYPVLGWCVPAIARLLGLPSALRSNALYRQCLANGGTVLNGQIASSARIAG